MFSRFVAVLPVAALAAVAAAAPNALDARTNQCNTGMVSCCNQTFKNPVQFQGLLGALLSVVVDVTANVGLTCSPITILGLGSGADCTVQTACCENIQVTGLINVVCSPITINL